MKMRQQQADQDKTAGNRKYNSINAHFIYL